MVPRRWTVRPGEVGTRSKILHWPRDILAKKGTRRPSARDVGPNRTMNDTQVAQWACQYTYPERVCWRCVVEKLGPSAGSHIDRPIRRDKARDKRGPSHGNESHELAHGQGHPVVPYRLKFSFQCSLCRSLDYVTLPRHYSSITANTAPPSPNHSPTRFHLVKSIPSLTASPMQPSAAPSELDSVNPT
jgi:hypothetical protein